MQPKHNSHTSLPRFYGLRLRLACPGMVACVLRSLIFVLLTSTFSDTNDARAADGDDLFDPSRILEIEIDVNPDDWDALRKQSRDFFSSLSASSPSESPFEYFKADIKVDGKLIKDVGIRKKGFLGSLDENRPSLKVRFDKYKSQSPFGKLDRLTLNNNKQDDSKLSQFLGYQMFSANDVPAPRCTFAKVSVNGKSLGIYSNVESVKPAMLTRIFGDGSGLLAEGTLADALPSVKKRFEYKRKPGKNTGIDRLTRILEQPQLDLEKLEETVNLESFIRFWATESLIGFWDGYTHNQNNYFIYENPGDSLLYFMPWGVDSAFTTYVPRIIDPIKNLSVHTTAALANRLYHHPETRAKYLKTLNSILTNQWDEEKLLAEVDRVESMLSDDALSRRRLQGGTDRVRGFIKTRRANIMKKLAQWPIPIEVGPRVPGLVVRHGELNGNFQTRWTSKQPKNPETQGETDPEVTLSGETIVFSSVGVCTKLDDNYDDKSRDGIKTPTIIFTGIRERDQKALTFIAKIKPEDFHPSTQPVAVNGVLIEGSWIAFFTMMSLNPAAIKLISGTIELEHASREDGATVAGSAELQIVGFAAKKASKVRWVAD